MVNSWRWTGARTMGTSHISSGLPCQDYILCMEIDSVSGSVLAGVVSDGAGSASHAEVGAKIVCTGFLRAVSEYFRSGGSIDNVSDEMVFDWLDSIRERINVFANRKRIRPRDCAATLVALLVGPRSALILHVGDGAAVVRIEGSADWIVPSWPFHGEYASTTAFVTDEPIPSPSVVRLPVRLDRIALFSDGLERLVLDHSNRTAYGPFFNRIIAPVATSIVGGSDCHLSKLLQEYLESKAICDRTDDDKSLVLGVRL